MTAANDLHAVVNRKPSDGPQPIVTIGRRRRPLRQRLRLPLMLGVPLLIALAAGYVYLIGGRYVSTDDAFVQAAQVSVSSNLAGRVAEVDVRDNQVVKKGQILFKLDDRPLRIALENAQAKLASARLQIASMKATYHQRQADLHGTQDTLSYEQREYDRQKKLLSSGIASQSQFDQATHALDVARQQAAATQQQMGSILASLGGNADIPIDQHPAVAEAQAEVDRAELNLSYTIITAPDEGIVTKVEQLQAGDYINAATPTFALVSDQKVWIEANFKETELTYMHPGQEATVEVDTYPDKPFTAHIVSLSPGTGSAFSLLPPENATGNWVKVVQRLPVRLVVDDTDAAHPLRMGMSVTVEVDTHHSRSLLVTLERLLGLKLS
jgi:membrane fusion protein (multidrug efflux system)